MPILHRFGPLTWIRRWAPITFALALAFAPTAAFAQYQFVPDAKDADAHVDKLRERIFGANAKAVACHAVSTGPQAKLEGIDPTLDKLLADAMTLLKDGKEKEFKPLFHPRVWKKDLGAKIQAILRNKYKTPWDLSVYRVWALNTPGTEMLPVPCPDDGLSVVTRYGYRLQFGALLQLMGQNELAHLFIAISPTEGRWNIVGWHIIQWTHLGKDFEAWAKDAMALRDKGRKLQAAMHFDLAQKLLAGGDFLAFDMKPRLVAERDAMDDQSAWVGKLNKMFATDAVVHAGTFLADDGVGLLIRELTTVDYTTPELRKRCLSRGKQLLREGWLGKDTGGLRCSYLLKGEDVNHEGQLGGFFYSVKDLETKPL